MRENRATGPQPPHTPPQPPPTTTPTAATTRTPPGCTRTHTRPRAGEGRHDDTAAHAEAGNSRPRRRARDRQSTSAPNTDNSGPTTKKPRHPGRRQTNKGVVNSISPGGLRRYVIGPARMESGLRQGDMGLSRLLSPGMMHLPGRRSTANTGRRTQVTMLSHPRLRKRQCTGAVQVLADRLPRLQSKGFRSTTSLAAGKPAPWCPPPSFVAAARGTRMGPNIDKLFLEVAGRPVAAHTCSALAAAPDVDEIVLVIRAGHATRVCGARGALGIEKTRSVRGYWGRSGRIRFGTVFPPWPPRRKWWPFKMARGPALPGPSSARPLRRPEPPEPLWQPSP